MLAGGSCSVVVVVVVSGSGRCRVVGRGKRLEGVGGLFCTLLTTVMLLLTTYNSGRRTSGRRSASGNTRRRAGKTKARKDSTCPVAMSPAITSARNGRNNAAGFRSIGFRGVPRGVTMFSCNFLSALSTLNIRKVIKITGSSALPTRLRGCTSSRCGDINKLGRPLLRSVTRVSPSMVFVSKHRSTFCRRLGRVTPIIFINASRASC